MYNKPRLVQVTKFNTAQNGHDSGIPKCYNSNKLTLSSPGLVVSYDLRPESRVGLFSKERVNKAVSWIGKEKQVKIKGSQWEAKQRSRQYKLYVSIRRESATIAFYCSAPHYKSKSVCPSLSGDVKMTEQRTIRHLPADSPMSPAFWGSTSTAYSHAINPSEWVQRDGAMRQRRFSAFEWQHLGNRAR